MLRHVHFHFLPYFQRRQEEEEGEKKIHSESRERTPLRTSP